MRLFERTDREDIEDVRGDAELELSLSLAQGRHATKMLVLRVSLSLYSEHF
jgi:hypothetical protein